VVVEAPTAGKAEHPRNLAREQANQSLLALSPLLLQHLRANPHFVVVDARQAIRLLADVDPWYHRQVIAELPASSAGACSTVMLLGLCHAECASTAMTALHRMSPKKQEEHVARSRMFLHMTEEEAFILNFLGDRRQRTEVRPCC